MIKENATCCGTASIFYWANNSRTSKIRGAH